MDGTFVEELRDSMRPEVTEVDGREYLISSKGAELITAPADCVIDVFSLDPFVTAIIKAPKGEGDEEILINVESPTLVRAIRAGRGLRGQQLIIAEADFEGIFKPFESGVKYNQEDFFIRLQSLFLMNPEMQDLLKLTSQVKDEQVRTSEDDGISQTVQVKGGVHLSKEMKVRNPWVLLPYKTFPEVKPVPVPYILRVSAGPIFALYESDGGRWKTETARVIRDYLTERFADLKLGNVTVL